MSIFDARVHNVYITLVCVSALEKHTAQYRHERIKERDCVIDTCEVYDVVVGREKGVEQRTHRIVIETNMIEDEKYREKNICIGKEIVEVPTFVAAAVRDW